MSIFHRATGCFMALTVTLIVWWFLAAAAGPDYFACAEGFLTSWLGILIMVASAATFSYHLMNGIRHLWWDIGNGFELREMAVTGVIALIGAGVLTLIILFVAM